jgi:hypothetical protein
VVTGISCICVACTGIPATSERLSAAIAQRCTNVKVIVAISLGEAPLIARTTGVHALHFDPWSRVTLRTCAEL